MGSIGITVGIIGYFLFFLIELLSDLKYTAVRYCSLKMTSQCIFGQNRCWAETSALRLLSAHQLTGQTVHVEHNPCQNLDTQAQPKITAMLT